MYSPDKIQLPYLFPLEQPLHVNLAIYNFFGDWLLQKFEKFQQSKTVGPFILNLFNIVRKK